MTRLPELRRALVEAAARLDAEGAALAPAAAPRPHARRGRARRSPARAVALALVVALALAAIAVAATGVLQRGSDVPPPSGRAPLPTRRLGVATGPVAAPLTTADTKDDNLLWGLRTFTTTRGYACLQVGRVQGADLGLVGRDGAFGDDGRFHALGPQVLEPVNCVPADGAGRGFLVLHYAAYPAGGYLSGCLDPWWAQRLKSTRDHRRACPKDDLRTLDFGLLGPHAVSITYRSPTGGGAHTAPVQRGTGAFLVVTPYEGADRRAPGERTMPYSVPSQDFLVGRSPAATTIVAVTYDDGTVCHVRHAIGTGPSAGGCPTPGYVPLRIRQPRHAEVATRMRLSITREADGRHRDLHVRFRARVAATGARAAYYVMLWPPGGGCHGTDIEGHAIEQDVRAGQRVGAMIRLTDGGCPGTYRVQLSYRIAVRRPGFAGVTNLHYPGTLVAAGDVTTR
jgi:hypothetical protein